jgi:PAS domain S-box-containing protein
MHLSESDLPELYRLLIDTLEDTAVFLIDTAGRFATWNPGVERLLGYSESDFIGRHAAVLFIPEEPGGAEQEMRLAAERGRALDQRWHLRRDGSRLYADGTLVALKDPSGGLIGFAKILRDITDKKRAEDEQRFLAEAGAILAGSLDYDTTLANVARLAVGSLADYCIVNLLTADRRVDRVAWTHRDPARQPVMDQAFQSGPGEPASDHPVAVPLLAGQSVFVPETTPEWMEHNLVYPGALLVAKEFGLQSIMLVPLRGRDFTLGALVFCFDRTSGRRYTERNLGLAQELGRRAGMAVENARLYKAALESEARLKENERTLRLATEAAGVGVWSLDAATRRLAWSEQGRRLLGLPPNAEPLGYSRFMELVHPDDRVRLDAAVRESLEDGAAFDVEFRVVFPDGAVRWIASKGLAQPGDDGRPARFSGVSIDITARKLAREAAEEANRLESIAMLAGGIAHEFNNLLTGIMGNASLIGEELPPGSRAAGRVDDLLASAERAAELTRQLLAYSGKGRYVPRHLDISEQVWSIAGLLQASLPGKVRLQLELPSGLPPIEADSDQIQQVVVALVMNAGEAIKNGQGAVTVKTAAADLDLSRIHDRFPGREIAPGPYVVLEVRDTGVGMDEFVKSRIFEPFFSTKFAGRGLGLAAVQGIVRGHGGAMEVESEPGSGATFRLFFPAAKGAGASGENGERRAAPAQGVILVADDEEIVRKVAKAALEKRGFQVVLAENGEIAVERFREAPSRFTAVLLDMAMPVMSGEEAMERIKSIRPDVPVIASSGYSEAEALRRFGTGISGYIQKPYTAAKLAGAVASIAGRN